MLQNMFKNSCKIVTKCYKTFANTVKYYHTTSRNYLLTLLLSTQPEAMTHDLRSRACANLETIFTSANLDCISA